MAIVALAVAMAVVSFGLAVNLRTALTIVDLGLAVAVVSLGFAVNLRTALALRWAARTMVLALHTAGGMVSNMGNGVAVAFAAVIGSPSVARAL